MQSNAPLPDTSRVRFFVVDGGSGRLLECRSAPPGRVHIDVIDAIENDDDEHEHARPSPRTGKSGNSYASEGHEDEQQRHRFAKRVVAWISEHAATFESPAIPLFAAPRFLGELRKLYGPELARRVAERQADLTGLSPASLARHPTVTELLST